VALRHDEARLSVNDQLSSRAAVIRDHWFAKCHGFGRDAAERFVGQARNDHDVQARIHALHVFFESAMNHAAAHSSLSDAPAQASPQRLAAVADVTAIEKDGSLCAPADVQRAPYEVGDTFLFVDFANKPGRDVVVGQTPRAALAQPQLIPDLFTPVRQRHGIVQLDDGAPYAQQSKPAPYGVGNGHDGRGPATYGLHALEPGLRKLADDRSEER